MKPQTSLLSALISIAIDIRQGPSTFEWLVRRNRYGYGTVEGEFESRTGRECERKGILRRRLLATKDLYHAHVYRVLEVLPSMVFDPASNGCFHLLHEDEHLITLAHFMG
jgi:hypothetical protein